MFSVQNIFTNATYLKTAVQYFVEKKEILSLGFTTASSFSLDHVLHPSNALHLVHLTLAFQNRSLI